MIVSKLKIGFLAFAIFGCIGCAGPRQSSSYRIGTEAMGKLVTIKSICFGQISCQDAFVAKAIKDVIVQELLPINIKILSDSTADAKIEITVTMLSDAALGGQSYKGTAAYSGSSGEYISGITVQIIKANEVLASVTTSQTRTPSGNPLPPTEMAVQLALKVACIIRYNEDRCQYAF